MTFVNRLFSECFNVAFMINIKNCRKINYVFTFQYIYIYIFFKYGKNWLQTQATTLLNKINITIYFENLTFELHGLYALNTHVKFCVNLILFII